MHVTITKGTQVFECETDYLEGEPKAMCEELIEGTIQMLSEVYKKVEQPVINTIEITEN
ncbi:MAG: hypothetical protein ABFD07_06125 [Methanobacterium sp.]